MKRGGEKKRRDESANDWRSMSSQRKRELLARLLRERRAEEALPLPVSAGQRSLWVLQKIASRPWSYNVTFAARVMTRVDAAALHRAFQVLADRHAALRTTYQQVDDRVRQKVVQDVDIDFERIDASGWTSAELREQAIVETRCPFDLERGPVCRVRLFTQAPDRHVLLFVIHHIAFDGWSLWILLDELREVYGAESSGRSHGLPTLAHEYRDFVNWQQEMVSGPKGEEHLTYWKTQLSGPLPILNLPFDGSRQSLESFEEAAYSFELGGKLTDKLRALATSTGTSLFSLLLAAFKVLLYRYTGQEDLIVGAPMSGRQRAEFEDLVGYFVNPVPIRSRPMGTLGFLSYLRQVHEAVVSADEHQGYPFALLVDQLNPPRDAGRSPVFQSRFVLQRSHKSGLEEATAFMVRRPSGRVSLGPLVLEPYPLPQQDGQYDLTMQVDAHGPLYFTLDYNADLLGAATIERMSNQFQVILDAIAANPRRPLAELPILTSVELDEIRAWNGTRTSYPRDRCVHEQFETQAKLTPHSVAAIHLDQSLTYRELNARANQLARYMQERGVGSGCRVAICLKRSLDMLVSVLAALKAGGAYVPLDPEYPEARLAFMLQDTRPTVLITSGQMLDMLPQLLRSADGAADFDPPSLICLDRDGPEISNASRENLELPMAPDEVAYVMYTSGSAGTPKGVEVRHCGVMRLLFGVDYVELNAEQVVLQLAPFSFDASTFEIWSALLHGGKLVLYPAEFPTPLDLERVLSAHHVTTLWLTGSLFNQVIDEAPNVLRGVKQLLIGGEALSVPHVRLALRALEGTQIINGYGPTENTTFTCCYRIPASLDESVSSIPIGRPIGNTQVYVLDRNLQLVPKGLSGELYVGGDGLARGYLNRDALTAQTFVVNPFAPEERLYRTGDTVRYLEDGCLEFLGRMDGQVKIRGFRIEVGEIEAVLVQHADVARAAVVVREADSGDKRLAAFVVVREGARLQSDELRDHLRKYLPEYMVPSYIVPLDRMPLNPNGKIDRRSLVLPSEPRRIERNQVPQTEIEKSIAAVWRDVLGLDEVDVQHNFFDLGGHSLLLAKVHDRLHEKLDCEFTIMDLFRYPSIRALASFLQDRRATSLPLLMRSKRTNLNRANHDIAIVGMAGRFPGASDIDAFWQNLRGGVESVVLFSVEDLVASGQGSNGSDHAHRVATGAVLDDIELFDAGFFGYSPREADLIDPQQRLFLECAWQALEAAGYDASRFDGLVGVYAGVTPSSYGKKSNGAPVLQAQITSDPDFLTSRVAYKLGLKGPSVGIQTACSTSLVAVHQACKALIHGECDMALAGGVSIRLPQKISYVHEPGSILSADGHCRAFDHRASGTVAGRGLGVVVLKRLDEAIAEGNTIWAVIKGTAVNNDGSARVGFTAPSVDGQAEVVAMAHADAEIDPDTISYVEAHGTGTELGDPIEIEALTRAFALHTDRKGFCAIGSVKTNIGHLDAAAGVTGLIKTVLALKHKQIPPSLHFERPNPKIAFESTPFFVNDRLSDWRISGGPRRAGVSSFGMGGTNAHVVLEEAPVGRVARTPRPEQLIVVSAKTVPALDDVIEQLAAYTASPSACDLADAAYTLQVGRRPFAHRAMAVCRDCADASSALRDPRRLRSAVCAGGDRATAFLFPGQGAQYVNMGQGLYESERVFRKHVDECCRYFKALTEVDLRERLYPKDARDDAHLTDTWLAQPALFVIEYALAKLWMSWGVYPRAMIGHSLGEYTAACLSGVFSLRDAIMLVATRGRLMQTMSDGRMLSIPLPANHVADMLGGRLSMAAINAPARCVVSGPPDEIDGLAKRLDEKGCSCRHLHTSHAFHSAMVDDILSPFADTLRSIEFGRPEVPFLSTVSGGWAAPEEVANPEYWIKQLRETVQFSRCVRALLSDTDCVLLEVGPGESLTTLVRQHREGLEDRLTVPSMRRVESDQSDESVILDAAGRLWLHGVPIDWDAYQAPRKRRRVPLPTYPFQRERHWVDADDVATSPVHLKKSECIDDWFYIPSWRRTAPPAKAPFTRARWCMFVDTHGLGAQMASRLSSDGHSVVTVEAGDAYARRRAGSYVINPADVDHYHKLLDDLRMRNETPSDFVHCWTVSSDDSAKREDLGIGRDYDTGFYSLLYLVQAVAAAGIDDARLSVFSSGVQDVTGLESLRPDRATVLGPCKVIPLEHPSIKCRHIDVVVPATNGFDAIAADAMLAELQSGFSDNTVAYRGFHRFVQSFEPARGVATQPTRLCRGGVYLITGGLGEVGLELADCLAGDHKATLVLTSRSGLSGQAKGTLCADFGGNGTANARVRRLRDLRSLGASIFVGRADVTRRTEMSQIVGEMMQRWGRIDGVIHAAGEPDQGCMMRDAGRDYCERQFAPKVRGLRVLDDVLQGCQPPLRLVVSSLASVLGVSGYCAYSAAHAFMDAFVWQMNRSGRLPWMTVNWDNWSTGTRATGQVSQGIAETLMTPQQGREAFSKALCLGIGPQVAVSTVDLNARIQKWQHRSDSDSGRMGAARPMPSRHRRPYLNTKYVMPTENRQRILVDIWQDLLGIDQIGIYDNFFELGGDSVVGIQVIGRARQAGLKLKPRQLFESRTIAELAAVAENVKTQEQIDERAANGDSVDRAREDISQSSTDVSDADLSEDELDDLMGRISGEP